MKQGWEIKKIKDICDKASSNIAQNKITELDGDYPVYGASGFVQNVDFYHRDTEYIGIVKDGSGVGRVNTYPAYSSLLGTLQYIIPKEGYALNYVAYALKSLNLAEYASGAAIPHIYFKDYGEESIPVPPREEQERIVAELDCLSGVIERKREQLRELDALAQSIFYQMFGDPITNEKGWEVKKLGEVCKTTSGGTPSKGHNEYYEGGTIPWLRSGEVNKMYIYDTELFITEEGLQKSSAKWFPVDTVVIAMYGATVGQVGILKNKMTTNQAICGIFPNKEFTPIYLYHFLLSKKDDYIAMAAGGAQPNISQNIIRDTLVCCPTIAQQQLFAERIDRIEQQKKLISQSIKEVEDLFNSRMSYYFN